MELYLDVDLLSQTQAFITGPRLTLAAVSRPESTWLGLDIKKQPVLELVLSC